MNFKSILDQFRSLGGVAENIDIGIGKYGRGLFPVDKKLPVKLVVPENLLINPEWISLDLNQQIILNDQCPLDKNIKSFFENYQRFFGWGDGGFDSIKNHHEKLLALPEEIKQFLFIFGFINEFELKATIDYCLSTYISNRRIHYAKNKKEVLMPVMELVNHGLYGKKCTEKNGFELSGLFNEEILAMYSRNYDAFEFFRRYQFSSPASFTLSSSIIIQHPSFGELHIARMSRLSEIRNKLIIPKTKKIDNAIHFSFLELTNKNFPDVPKKIFSDLMKDYKISNKISDEIFNGLIRKNRELILDFLKTCDKYDLPLIDKLKTMAYDQLESSF